jgi:sugar phosphate isomerase/epimerase
MRALNDIRIGTMVKAGAANVGATARELVKLGFESLEPFFWQTMEKDLPKLAIELKEAIGDADVTIDTLGMFGNPLETGELDLKTLAGWEALIDHAHLFGAKTIAGFTGRIRGKPIEASLPRYVASPSRIARWTAIGPAAIGTSRTIRTHGS